MLVSFVYSSKWGGGGSGIIFFRRPRLRFVMDGWNARVRSMVWVKRRGWRVDDKADTDGGRNNRSLSRRNYDIKNEAIDEKPGMLLCNSHRQLCWIPATIPPPPTPLLLP